MTNYDYPLYEYEYPSTDYHYYENIMTMGDYDYFEKYTADVNLVLEILTILINIFHLFFLSQKEVRSNSIYILMIAICISDLLNFSISLYMEGVDRKWYYRFFEFSNIDCLREDYVVFNLGYEVLRMIINFTRPISVSLAILMALIRTFTLIFPLKSWITKLANFKISIAQIMLISLFWIIYYSWPLAFLRNLWYPDNLCNDEEISKYSVNITVFVYAIPLEIHGLLYQQSDWEHWIRIIPTLFYPVLSLKLMWKIREIKEQRRKASDIGQMRKEKSDNLTQLILFMTISFMLSEGLDGIRNFLLIDLFYWAEESPGLRRLLLSSQHFIVSLRCLNSMSHLFICYFMSSQYRNTVNQMFCATEKPKVIAVKSFGSIDATSRRRSLRNTD